MVLKLDVIHESSLYSGLLRPLKFLIIKRYEKTYRKDLLHPSLKNDLFWVFRDLLITVINRTPIGRGQQSLVFQAKVHSVAPFQAPGIVPSAHSPKLSDPQELITPQHGWESMPACSFFVLLCSREIKQQWIIFFTRLTFLLLGENTWKNEGSEDQNGRNPELAQSLEP